MAVSSGLKRSQRVSKCVETLGAEHIRESQAVSRCHETLGAERIHASHKVTRCHATLVAGPTRASRRVSTGPTTLGAECIHRSRNVYGTARLRHFSHSCVQETSFAIQLAPLTHALVRETRKHAITRARNKQACNHAGSRRPLARISFSKTKDQVLLGAYPLEQLNETVRNNLNGITRYHLWERRGIAKGSGVG